MFVSNIVLFLLKWGPWDFPGGPVVKTLPSNAGAQMPPLVRKLRFHMSCGQKKQNIEQKQYYNKFNKDFKNSPHQKKKKNLRWGSHVKQASGPTKPKSTTDHALTH